MKKIVLSLGTIAAISAPIITVVACGNTSSTNDDKNINLVEGKILRKAILSDKDWKTSDEIQYWVTGYNENEVTEISNRESSTTTAHTYFVSRNDIYVNDLGVVSFKKGISISGIDLSTGDYKVIEKKDDNDNIYITNKQEMDLSNKREPNTKGDRAATYLVEVWYLGEKNIDNKEATANKAYDTLYDKLIDASAEDKKKLYGRKYELGRNIFEQVGFSPVNAPQKDFRSEISIKSSEVDGFFVTVVSNPDGVAVGLQYYVPKDGNELSLTTNGGSEYAKKNTFVFDAIDVSTTKLKDQDDKEWTVTVAASDATHTILSDSSGSYVIEDIASKSAAVKSALGSYISFNVFNIPGALDPATMSDAQKSAINDFFVRMFESETDPTFKIIKEIFPEIFA